MANLPARSRITRLDGLILFSLLAIDSFTYAVAYCPDLSPAYLIHGHVLFYSFFRLFVC